VKLSTIVHDQATGLQVPNTRLIARENLKLISTPAEFFDEEEYSSRYSEMYVPVSYHKLAVAVEAEIANQLGPNAVTDATYHIKDKRKLPGAQMLGIYRLRTKPNPDADSYTPILAFRTSNDKSTSIQFASGEEVHICTNWEIFSGNYEERLKHMGNVMERLPGAIRSAVGFLRDTHNASKAFRDITKRFQLDTEEGARVLGELAFSGRLRLNYGERSQYAIAIQEWKEPTHEVFRERTVWSLFNACTEAKKRSNSFASLTRSGNELRGFFCDRFALPDSTRVIVDSEPTNEEEEND
jgi:hypothetical protein